MEKEITNETTQEATVENIEHCGHHHHHHQTPVMPIYPVQPMPFDPFCPQFTPEEALVKGTLFKWLYSPYHPQPQPGHCPKPPKKKCC